jgi:hypothetical protein
VHSWIVGTHGNIRATKSPFPNEGTAAAITNVHQYTAQAVTSVEMATEYQCHALPITKIRLSYDETHLFTIGEDGCLWVYKINDKTLDKVKREKDSTFSDEILVTRSDLKEKFRIMNSLRKQVEARHLE